MFRVFVIAIVLMTVLYYVTEWIILTWFSDKGVVDKAMEAEQHLNKAKKIYNDLGANMQKEIDDAELELEKKKTISERTKKRLQQISNKG